MDLTLLLIAGVAFAASLLTFFSGFGLGTILLPVFVLSFDIEIAIVLTAIVHFLNNAFKFFLTGKNLDSKILIRFGAPALLCSFLGALVLKQLSLAGETLNIVVGTLMIAFAFIELLPMFRNRRLPEKWILIGGALSGFFGGLSGHQGAFRSIFLVRSTQSKETFVATGIAIALLVDLARLTIYIPSFKHLATATYGPKLIIAIAASFLGAMAGQRTLKKVTLAWVQNVVAIVLILLGIYIIWR
jgi:uncharacterized membrane protein YfcA